ncbi:MAG TPA: SDR family NAD(P)-dependent oxidoreductase [Methylomirabilota bacterium]|nr:SDR family NAD(P)-dependent oxidoreductase [Methylomirabilota bacterium]
MAVEGRVALVTGAQQGIGRATAVALARAGADVALNYLDDRAATDKAAEEIRGLGRRALVVQGDVSRAAEVAAMVAAVGRGLGVPDILVNNAGVYPRSPFLELAEREWDLVLGVNLKGSFLCAQAVARALVATGRRGAIVNIASQAIRGAPLGVHYTASKGGVVAMTRAMALALAPHGIRVNAVAPGTTDTAQPRYEHSEAAMAEISRAVPLGHMAAPEDIADVIVFLASDAARHITGETVHANGGSYMA